MAKHRRRQNKAGGEGALTGKTRGSCPCQTRHRRAKSPQLLPSVDVIAEGRKVDARERIQQLEAALSVKDKVIQSLQRELEVAKATVRKIALQH